MRSFSASTVRVDQSGADAAHEKRDTETPEPRRADLESLHRKLCNPQHYYDLHESKHGNLIDTKSAEASTEPRSSSSFDEGESRVEWFQKSKLSLRSQQSIPQEDDTDDFLEAYHRSFARLERRHGGDQRASMV